MVNKTIVNKKYSVRNYRSVENNTKTCMSRGLPTVFHVIDSAPRETYSCLIIFATKVVLLENKVKMRFNNSIVNGK
jgi:hypothetical protein